METREAGRDSRETKRGDWCQKAKVLLFPFLLIFFLSFILVHSSLVIWDKSFDVICKELRWVYTCKLMTVSTMKVSHFRFFLQNSKNLFSSFSRCDLISRCICCLISSQQTFIQSERKRQRDTVRLHCLTGNVNSVVATMQRLSCHTFFFFTSYLLSYLIILLHANNISEKNTKWFDISN